VALRKPPLSGRYCPIGKGQCSVSFTSYPILPLLELSGNTFKIRIVGSVALLVVSIYGTRPNHGIGGSSGNESKDTCNHTILHKRASFFLSQRISKPPADSKLENADLGHLSQD
jgi:hypothetical protein